MLLGTVTGPEKRSSAVRRSSAGSIQRMDCGVCGGQEGPVWGSGRECGRGGHGRVSVHMGRGTQGLKVHGEDTVSPRPTSGCQEAAAEPPGQEGDQKARSPVHPAQASHRSLGKAAVPGPAPAAEDRSSRPSSLDGCGRDPVRPDPPPPSSRHYSLHQRRFSHRRSNCPHLPLPAQAPGGGAPQPQAWTGPAGVDPG